MYIYVWVITCVSRERVGDVFYEVYRLMWFPFTAGDMEFKQNKYLPAEKQIVTANPDINTVCISCHKLTFLITFCVFLCNMVTLEIKSPTFLHVLHYCFSISLILFYFILFFPRLKLLKHWYSIDFFFLKVELCDDDDFIVLACDGIW